MVLRLSNPTGRAAAAGVEFPGSRRAAPVRRDASPAGELHPGELHPGGRITLVLPPYTLFGLRLVRPWPDEVLGGSHEPLRPA